MAELIVFLALRYGLMGLDHAGLVPEVLQMPLVGISWIYFLVVIVLVAWRRHQGDDWADLGLPRAARPLADLGLAMAGVLAAYFLDGLTQPFLEAAFGSSQDLSSLRPLVGSVPYLLMIFPMAWIFAALGEEVFFRGWLMRRIAKLLGDGHEARAAALIMQAALFGLAHLYQGPGGMIGTAIYGLIYGALVLRRRGNLWAAILAHGLVDTIGVIAIFSGALPT